MRKPVSSHVGAGRRTMVVSSAWKCREEQGEWYEFMAPIPGTVHAEQSLRSNTVD